MYIPHHYQNTNLEEIRAFLNENAFAILVNQVDGQPWASHIPLELSANQDGSDKLIGHLAKANPQWKSFSEQPKVLAIFNGPHSYVSSSWYREEEVPTWNYIAVHIYGTVRIQSESELYESLVALVDKYEQESEHPVSVPDLSKATMRQIKGIVGFEISIDKIQAAYKLSQGRSQDHATIISKLEQRNNPGSKAIARAIQRNSSK